MFIAVQVMLRKEHVKSWMQVMNSLSVHLMQYTLCIPRRYPIMTTRSLEDIYSYEQQALDLLNKDHPHFDEIRSLLVDQINDEIHDYAYTRTN